MKKTSSLFLTLSLSLAALVMALGVWWLYLLQQFGVEIQAAGNIEKGAKITSMIKWEGGVFLTLLFFLMGALIFLYFKDQKKTKSLAAFYAGMTHELKTPLASMRLQAEVLDDLITSKNSDENQQMNQLTKRLIQDSNKLETQMDKILQLSRIEGGGNLNFTPVDLKDFIQKTFHRWGEDQGLALNIEKNLEDYIVIIDELALGLVLRNLFENTYQHSQEKNINISWKQEQQFVHLKYDDNGVFNGDAKRLGELFYKYNSPKGSGIGLYLIKKLIKRMGGELSIQQTPRLLFHLKIKGERHV